MNILVFEYKHFGIEDLKDTFARLNISYKVVTSEFVRERVNSTFDELFDREFSSASYDCVFSFNYSPVISVNCNKRNVPYISLVYDSPQIMLYSYTIINPCNYCFIFDKAMYMDLKKEGINTVYYAPLCANTARLDKMKPADAARIWKKNAFSNASANASGDNAGANVRDDNANAGDAYASDISFVGSMYNEAHTLYDRLIASGISEFTHGYLDSIINAQMKVYGYFFMDEMLNSAVLDDMMKHMPVQPNPDGVETINYIYAHYFMARKLASRERMSILKRLSCEFVGSSPILSSDETKLDICDSNANVHYASGMTKVDSLGTLSVTSKWAKAGGFSIDLFTPNATPDLACVNNHGPIDYYNDCPLVFKTSRINLNISLRSIRSGIPLRCMDIMGAGGFLMSNYQEDFYDYFVPGKDCVLFESHDDLVSKCRYYLSHENERRQIAENGHGKIAEHHTYDVRIKEMLDIVFNN